MSYPNRPAIAAKDQQLAAALDALLALIQLVAVNAGLNPDGTKK